MVGTPADPRGGSLELLEDRTGALHVALCHRDRVSTDALAAHMGQVEATLRAPVSPAIAPLVLWDPTTARFVYRVGEGVLLSTLLQIRSALGPPAGIRAGLELLVALGPALDAVADDAVLGVVDHGAVHPWRVVVRRSGSVVLVGHGLAWLHRVRGLADDAPDSTLPYRAPEVAAGAGPDLRADVFAATACAVALILGPSADGADPASRVRAAALRDDLCQMLLEGLAPDPEHRLGSGQALADRAAALLVGLDAGWPSLFELASASSASEGAYLRRVHAPGPGGVVQRWVRAAWGRLVRWMERWLGAPTDEEPEDAVDEAVVQPPAEALDFTWLEVDGVPAEADRVEWMEIEVEEGDLDPMPLDLGAPVSAPADSPAVAMPMPEDLDHEDEDMDMDEDTDELDPDDAADVRPVQEVRRIEAGADDVQGPSDRGVTEPPGPADADPAPLSALRTGMTATLEQVLELAGSARGWQLQGHEEGDGLAPAADALAQLDAEVAQVVVQAELAERAARVVTSPVGVEQAADALAQFVSAAKAASEASSNARRALLRLRDARATVDGLTVRVQAAAAEASRHVDRATQLVEGLASLVDEPGAPSAAAGRARHALTWARKAASRAAAVVSTVSEAASIDEARAVGAAAREALDDTAVAARRVAKEARRAREALGRSLAAAEAVTLVDDSASPVGPPARGSVPSRRP